jgi:hypothetical protein
MGDSLNKNSATAEANNPAHYATIIVGIVIGLTGIFLRFTGSWPMISLVSNVLWVAGAVICLRSVLKILK